MSSSLAKIAAKSAAGLFLLGIAVTQANATTSSFQVVSQQQILAQRCH